MPIYEYTCASCEQKFEKLVRSMSAPEKVSCPECGSTKTARSLSVFAVGAEARSSASVAPPTCGRCGGAPGSCASGLAT